MGSNRTTPCTDRRCLVHSVPDKIVRPLVKRAFDKIISQSFDADEMLEFWRITHGTR